MGGDNSNMKGSGAMKEGKIILVDGIPYVKLDNGVVRKVKNSLRFNRVTNRYEPKDFVIKEFESQEAKNAYYNLLQELLYIKVEGKILNELDDFYVLRVLSAARKKDILISIIRDFIRKTKTANEVINEILPFLYDYFYSNLIMEDTIIINAKTEDIAQTINELYENNNSITREEFIKSLYYRICYNSLYDLEKYAAEELAMYKRLKWHFKDIKIIMEEDTLIYENKGTKVYARCNFHEPFIGTLYKDLEEYFYNRYDIKYIRITEYEKKELSIVYDILEFTQKIFDIIPNIYLSNLKEVFYTPEDFIITTISLFNDKNIFDFTYTDLVDVENKDMVYKFYKNTQSEIKAIMDLYKKYNFTPENMTMYGVLEGIKWHNLTKLLSEDITKFTISKLYNEEITNIALLADKSYYEYYFEPVKELKNADIILIGNVSILDYDYINMEVNSYSTYITLEKNKKIVDTKHTFINKNDINLVIEKVLEHFTL
jgi:hypothetical protein